MTSGEVSSELVRLRNQIETAKKNVVQDEVRIDGVRQRISELTGGKSPEEIPVIMNELENEIRTYELQITEKFKRLTEEYEW